MPNPLDEYKKNLWPRRIALILGILLSGGMLILPRMPMLILLIGFSLAATGWCWGAFARTSKVWLLLIIILLASLVRPGPFDVGSLMIRYANFVAGLFLLAAYLRNSSDALSKDLFAIMPWMATQAVLTFVLANTIPSIFSIIELPDEGSINTFLLIFNYHVVIADYSGWQRPDGFFWEPGVFQMYLNLYLYLSLFVFRRKFHVLLSLLALICVYSTTGVLITGFLLAAALLQRLSKGNLKQRLLIFLTAVLISPVLGHLAFKNLHDKFAGEAQGSYTIRQYDLLAGLRVISEYPLLGIGFDHRRYQEIASDDYWTADRLGLPTIQERATSNGVVYLGYVLGVPLALVFIWGIFKQRVLPYPWLVGMVLLLSMLGEVLIFTPFILLIIFSAFTNSSLKPPRHKNN